MTRYFTRANDVEFDHVFTIMSGGTITDGPSGIYAPSSHDGELDGSGWDYFTHGYTGQYGYRGPIMHPSEFIGGRLERDMLAEPGIYAVVIDSHMHDDSGTDGECSAGCDTDDDDSEPNGWAVVKFTGELPTRGRYIGLWHGGHSYSHAEWTDAEWFSTIADAVDTLRDRERGRSCTFRYVLRADDTTDCPCAHSEWSGSIFLYRAPDGTTTDDVEMIGGAYPDRVVRFGPRGGVRVENV